MLCRYCRTAVGGGQPCCRRCVALHEAAWETILDRRSIYRETDLKVLQIKHPHLMTRYSDVLAYNHHSDKGLVLHGDSGTGKTRITWLLMRRLHDDGVPVGAISAPALGEGLSNSAFDGEMTDWIVQLSNCEVLFIDDLDKLVATPRVQQGLYTAIEHMTSTGRKLVITTNLTGPAFRQRFDPAIGPAIGRRIGQFCRQIKFWNVEEAQ